MLKIDKDLLKDINFEDLDFTLVDRYQKFLFLNVDDYSVTIGISAKIVSIVMERKSWVG